MELTSYFGVLIPPTRCEDPYFNCEEFRNQFSRHISVRWLGSSVFEIEAQDDKHLSALIDTACRKANMSQFDSATVDLRFFKSDSEVKIMEQTHVTVRGDVFHIRPCRVC